MFVVLFFFKFINIGNWIQMVFQNLFIHNIKIDILRIIYHIWLYFKYSNSPLFFIIRIVNIQMLFIIFLLKTNKIIIGNNSLSKILSKD